MWAPGMGELLIIMVVVLLVFGTSRLKNVGKDLGGAISEFKSSMKPEDAKDKEEEAPAAKSEEKTEEKVEGSPAK